MRSKKWRDKGISTETLTAIEVDEILAGSKNYECGSEPPASDTQDAVEVQDAADVQDATGLQEAAPEDFQAAFREAFQEDFRDDNPEDVQDNCQNDYQDGCPDESGDAFWDELQSDAGSGSTSETQFTLEPFGPEDEKYEDIMDNYEEVMEKMSSNPTKPKYWFKEKGDHWYCSCGQLNEDAVCSNCGLERDLLRALFFLHEPGDEPGKFEGMDVHYTDVDVDTRRMGPKAKLGIAIAIVLLLLAGTGAFAYFYIVKPSIEQEAAADAAAKAESIAANVPECTADMKQFVRKSYVTAGNKCKDEGRYLDAITLYRKAQNISKKSGTQDKINDAKYGYVKTHRSDGGQQFEEFLMDLHEINYAGVDEIYTEYFAWHIKVIANKKKNNTTADIKRASRADTVYFHVFLSGGPPGETLDLYYEAQWPNGFKQTDDLGKDWKAGSSQAVAFMYPVPIMGAPGQLTFKVFNKNTQALMGSDSVELRQ